jgi:hypothetical protein
MPPAATNIMLAVHCKKGEALDIKTPLWNYISSAYSDSQAHDASEDLEEIGALRSAIVAQTGSLSSQRDALAK